jgi:hypothetical protein
VYPLGRTLFEPAMTVGAARHWAGLALVLAALAAGGATAFGFEFARDSHAHGEAGEPEHADAEKTMPPGEKKRHGAEHGAEAGHEADEEADGAGMVVSAILIGLVGGALAPLTGFMGRRPKPEEAEKEPPGSTGSVPLQLAMLSAGAAMIHFAVIAQHLDEWWLAGVFFIVVAVFQLVWALLIALQPSVPVCLTGAVVNALVVATWIVSRTTGVPAGPEAGKAESVGFPDVLATAFEALLVVLSVVLISQLRDRRPAPRSAVGWPLGITVAALTALALAILA